MVFVASFVILLSTLAAMAIGVMFARPPIKGSCGGLANIPGLGCGLCKNRHKCKKKNQEDDA